MTIDRAFRVAHNLDVPSSKRGHWPKWAVIVVRDSEDIRDVIQFFEHPNEEDQLRCLQSYPKSMSFTVHAGESFTVLREFEARVRSTAALAVKLANEKA